MTQLMESAPRPLARRQESSWQREIEGRAALALYAVVACATTTFMLVRLFAGGVVGMSDQGDGTRLLCGLGLREGNPYNTSTTDYLYPTWYHHTWWGEDCGASGSGEAYHSTETWFARVGVWMTRLFTSTDGLDLRMLGVLFSVLVGLLVAGVVAALPGRLALKLVAAVALCLVVGDGAFAGYFVSAYSEPAGFVGVLLMMVAVLVFFRSERVTWWSLAFLAGATLFTVTAKTQTATLLVSVVPLLFVRPSHGPSVARRMAALRRPRRRTLRPDRTALAYRARFLALSRWPALLVSVVLSGGTVAYLHEQPQRFTVQNDYAAVFIEMLPHSNDPAADLEKLGLPATMASSSSVPINATGSAASRLDFYDFTDEAGLGARLPVYAAQPSRLGGMLHRGLDGMAVDRADYIYSYPRSAGLGPNRFECRVCVVQKAWTTVFGKAPWLILAALLGCLAVCGFAAVSCRERDGRAAGVTGLVLGTAVVTQFWAVMLTEGASDLIKHMVFTNLLLALLFVVTGVAGSTYFIEARADRRHLDQPNPSSDRTVGESKMDGDVVRESLVRVASWGVRHRSGQLSSLLGASGRH
jgi:hypothetical protein